MAAGGGARALKVRIIGDASDVIRSIKQTARSMDDLGDETDRTDRKLDGFARTAAKAGAVLGGTLVTTLKASSVGMAALGAASLTHVTGATALLGGLSAAAVGAVAAIGGLGVVFAAQNLAVAGSFGRLLADMKAEMQEVSAAFVPAMLLISERIRGVFDNLAPRLRPLFDEVAPLLSTFVANLGEGLALVFPVFEEFVRAGTGMVRWINDHMLPVFTELAKFSPVGFIRELFHHVGPLLDVLRPVAGALGEMATTIASALGPVIQSVLPPLAEFLAALGTELGPLIGELGRQLGGVLTSALRTLEPLLPVLGDALMGFIETAGPALVDVFTQLGPPLVGVLEALAPMVPLLADLAGSVLSSLATALAPVVDALRPFVEQLAAQLEPVIRGLTPILQDFGEQIGPLIAENLRESLPLFLDLTEALLPIIPPMVDIIAQIVIFSARVPVAAGVLSDLIDKFEEVHHTVMGVVVPALDWLVSVVTSMPSTIGSALYGMWDGLKNGFRDAINWIIDRWNGLSFTTPNLPGTNFGGQTISVMQIPRLHTGGTFRAPTPGGEGLAWLRDRERVSTPGSDGGGVYISVNPITGQVMVEELSAHQRRGGVTPWVQVA